MSRRQTPRHTETQCPRIWLMTDPRFGADLLPAVKRLPVGSAVIFRHYELEPSERRALFARVRHICRQRGHLLLLAGDERTARSWHADGFHSRNGGRQSRMILRSAPVHNRRELSEALRAGADIILLSPIFSTASHPDTIGLGRTAFMALASQCGDMKVVALGGMTARKAATLDKRVVHGWAAIDALRL